MMSDAVLVDRVIAGFDDAFDELYRRHSSAAWRLGQAVTGNAHDAADAVSEAFARVLQAVRDRRLEDGSAFRSYLLTATRNAALDGLRRQGRTRPTDDEVLDLRSSSSPTPDVRATDSEDAALVAEAFRNLPERWRSVLWLTEVEGVATKDAADRLGLSPNGAAQLAVRAHNGLRERYLQAHVRNHARPECRFTVEHLGAYVGGGISPRDLAKVDQHLAGCDDCRARKEELDDLGSTLRRIVLPVPLTLGALSARKVHAVLASSATPANGFGARALQLAKEPTPLMRKAVAASAAGVLALGVLSLGFYDDADPRVAGLAAPKSAGGAPVVAEVPAADLGSAPSFSGSFGRSGSFDLPSSTRRSFTVPSSPKPATATKPAAKPQSKPAPAAQTRPEQPTSQLPVLPLPEIPVPPSPVPVPLPTASVAADLLGEKLGVSVDLTGEAPVVGVQAPLVGTIGEAPAPAEEENSAVINLGSPINQTIGLP